MKLDSARDLKLELAREVFAPLANRLLAAALEAPLPFSRLKPKQRVAIGIARGSRRGDFTLAVRLQSRSRITQEFVELIRAKVRSELDVDFIGVVKPQTEAALTTAELRAVRRPLVVGCSVGHPRGETGTIGMIAQQRKTGRSVILSNNHVLARAGEATIGDAVTQPGKVDGGGAADNIGALLDFAPLKTDGSNHVDAATALIDDGVPIINGDVPGVGAISLADDPTTFVSEAVVKVGRTTGLTHGTVTAAEIDDIIVDYGIGQVEFDDQIEITGVPGIPFSDRGDSGSLVVTEDGKVLGLLFAGNPHAAHGAGKSYANPIGRVMSAMDLLLP
jgi:hypothetical protein